MESFANELYTVWFIRTFHWFIWKRYTGDFWTINLHIKRNRSRMISSKNQLSRSRDGFKKKNSSGGRKHQISDTCLFAVIESEYHKLAYVGLYTLNITHACIDIVCSAMSWMLLLFVTRVTINMDNNLYRLNAMFEIDNFHLEILNCLIFSV